MRAIHWFRNDLRLRDNHALATAARAADELLPVFVLDPRLIEAEPRPIPRLRFLADCLRRLASDLVNRGSGLAVRTGDPVREIPKLVEEAGARLLTFNRDVSPYARRRDEQVGIAVRRLGGRVLDCADRTVFPPGEIRTRSGGSFVVYTPYRNAWRRRLAEDPPRVDQAPRLPPPIAGAALGEIPGDQQLALAGDSTDIPTGGEDAARRRLKAFLDDRVRHYVRDRDLPAVDGTSRLSPHLRFGTISIRECVQAATERGREDHAYARGCAKWVDELVWREFYLGLLAERPELLGRPLRREFEHLEWNDDEAGFEAWCHGRTGYPFVDAGMRQLVSTGWMHNRARMVVASFLTKDLLIDWRRGERFFFERLVDGDPAANNGGWQWAASTGADAQPYFRIFNPVSQGEKLDPNGAYVRRYVPELRRMSNRFVHRPWEAESHPPGYPEPIVDHGERRAVALRRFESARGRRR